MLLPIEAISPGTVNARRTASDRLSDEQLRASIQTLGMVQPIAVTRVNGDNHYSIVAGGRRYAAAVALGWSEVPVIVHEVGHGQTSALPAMSAAENLVREPMHPVDAWRAVDRLMQEGHSQEHAGLALGMTPAVVRRLSHLAGMAPELLDVMLEYDTLPPESVLRRIALAPHSMQLTGIKRGVRAKAVDWHAVAVACTVERISMVHALFDPKEADVAFDEDLFAQGDDHDRFTTSDIPAFLTAQREALRAKAEASKGRLTAMVWSKTQRLNARLPKGWRASYDKMPLRWKKDDPRRAFACVSEDHYELGQVTYVVGHPVEVRAPAADGVSDKMSDTWSPAARMPINKVTLDRLAELKRQAVVESLPLVAANENAADALRGLLLMLSFENVNLQTSAQKYGARPMRELASMLIDLDGHPLDLDETALIRMAFDVIAKVIKFDGQDSRGSSGQQAEWMARMVGAEPPRCDTLDILKGCSPELVIELARKAGIDDKGTTSEVRKRLVGNLPDWRPAAFDAAGPSSGYQPDDDDNDASDTDPQASDNLSDTGETEDEA